MFENKCVYPNTVYWQNVNVMNQNCITVSLQVQVWKWPSKLVWSSNGLEREKAELASEISQRAANGEDKQDSGYWLRPRPSFAGVCHLQSTILLWTDSADAKQKAAVKDQVDIHTDFATISAPLPLHCVAQAVKFLITNPRLLNVLLWTLLVICWWQL